MTFALHTDFLPQATPYDPAEDPPGGVDPLGTLSGAESLAEVLLPGLTARMWRARLLTWAALAVRVAERVVETASTAEDGESYRDEARLAAERFCVSALARHDDWGKAATQRLPGIRLARRALAANDRPLGPEGFLKGQAVNGPIGVIARLARAVNIIDEDYRLGRGGHELLAAWERERHLPGIIDERPSKNDGSRLITRFANGVRKHLQESWWPRANWPLWNDLARHLRLDELGPQETDVILRLLADDVRGVRRRVLELLQTEGTVATYRHMQQVAGRGTVARTVLVEEILPRTQGSSDEIDRDIIYTVRLIDAYEAVAGLLEVVFRTLQWALTRRSGQANNDSLLHDPAIAQRLEHTTAELRPDTETLRTLLAACGDHPCVSDVADLSAARELSDDALQAGLGPEQLLEVVMSRHHQVQKARGKGPWIARDGQQWTLMPGFGDNREEPPVADSGYLHPMRIRNAYSFLRDLRRVSTEIESDGEEES